MKIITDNLGINHQITLEIDHLINEKDYQKALGLINTIPIEDKTDIISYREIHCLLENQQFDETIGKIDELITRISISKTRGWTNAYITLIVKKIICNLLIEKKICQSLDAKPYGLDLTTALNQCKIIDSNVAKIRFIFLLTNGLLTKGFTEIAINISNQAKKFFNIGYGINEYLFRLKWRVTILRSIEEYSLLEKQSVEKLYAFLRINTLIEHCMGKYFFFQDIYFNLSNQDDFKKYREICKIFMTIFPLLQQKQTEKVCETVNNIVETNENRIFILILCAKFYLIEEEKDLVLFYLEKARNYNPTDVEKIEIDKLFNRINNRILNLTTK